MAIAQLVLTLTRFQGIGQVLFTRDGVPIDVPLPPNDELAELGEPVAYEDFAILLVAQPERRRRPPPPRCATRHRTARGHRRPVDTEP